MSDQKLSKEARKKALLAATNSIKKQYGQDAILDLESKRIFDVIPSGSLLFDEATSIGGIPRGRLIEVYGENGSGKTSMCYCWMAQSQRKYPDEMILFIDIEQAFFPTYCEQFGVDLSPDKVIVVQPNTIEEAFTMMLTYMETGLFSLIILDSVGASLTQDQLEKGMEENTMGSLAKKMSVGGNKAKNLANQTNTAVVFVNQTYDKMTYMGGKETKGGRALKYYASLRIELAKRDLMASENDKETTIGQAIRFKFIKNKVGQPYKMGETLLYFGKGFDPYSEIVEVAINNGFIERAGAWYKFLAKDGTEMKFQGKDKVIDYFKNSPKDFEYYENNMKAFLANQLSVEEIAKLKQEEKEDV